VPQERLPDSSKRDRPSLDTGRRARRRATELRCRREAKRSQLKDHLASESEPCGAPGSCQCAARLQRSLLTSVERARPTRAAWNQATMAAMRAQNAWDNQVVATAFAFADRVRSLTPPVLRQQSALHSVDVRLGCALCMLVILAVSDPDQSSTASTAQVAQPVPRRMSLLSSVYSAQNDGTIHVYDIDKHHAEVNVISVFSCCADVRGLPAACFYPSALCDVQPGRPGTRGINRYDVRPADMGPCPPYPRRGPRQRDSGRQDTLHSHLGGRSWLRV